MPLLHVQNFSKLFYVAQLDRRIPVFVDLSFSVQQGEFVLIRGPNGVGKSSLLRCLYRTYLPTSGHAFYESQYGTVDLARAANVDIALLRKTDIGHVTQFLRPRPRVSALDLATEPLVLLGHSPDNAQEMAREWLAALGLKRDIWHAYPTTFSGGEQQKVNLARALIAPRRLLLLDEPTASLDATTRGMLVERLQQMKAQGVTMLGIFHHAEDVQELIDRTIELNPVPSTPAKENGDISCG
jgi:alpha-D-ribose 1-methylphosphonate 5-triphosphate synthase subunit PhnL